MADYNWPPGLPEISVTGYAREGDDGVIRSEFPGSTKIRPRFTKPPPEQVSAQVICSQAEMQTLMDFWEVTLRRVLAFNYRDHTKPDATTVEYRFLSRPTRETYGSPYIWRVTLQLEQLTTYQGTFPLGDGGGSLLGDGTGNTITT